MKPITSFLRSERGAISLEYVVLAAGAFGLATAAAAAYSDQTGVLSFNVAAGFNNTERRPAFAYVPRDILAHQVYVDRLSDLEQDDLDAVSAWANSVRPESGSFDKTAADFFADFDNAVTETYANRNQSRGNETDVSDGEKEQALAAFSGQQGNPHENF